MSASKAAVQQRLWCSDSAVNDIVPSMLVCTSVPALALLARIYSVSYDCHVFRCVLIARKRKTSICITSRCTVSLPMSKRMKKIIDSLPESILVSEPSPRTAAWLHRSIRFRSVLRKQLGKGCTPHPCKLIYTFGQPFAATTGRSTCKPVDCCDLELAVVMMAASYEFPTADLDKVYTKSLAEVGLLVTREFPIASYASSRALVRYGPLRRLCLC